MADDAIEIEYQLNVDDLVKLSHKSNKSSKYGYIFHVLMIIFMLLFMIVFQVISERIFEWLGYTQELSEQISSVLLLLIVLCGIVSLTKYFSKKRYSESENTSIFSPTVMRLDCNGLHSNNAHISFDVRWSGVEKIVNNNRNIYIYYCSMGAFIIPDRAFKSDEIFDKFYQKCLGYYQAAQEKDEVND